MFYEVLKESPIGLRLLGNQPALDLIHDFAHWPHNRSLEEVKIECYKEMKLCLWRLKVNNEYPDEMSQLNLFLKRMQKRCPEPFVQYFFDKLDEIIYMELDVDTDTLKNEFFEEMDVELKLYSVYKPEKLI